MTTAASLKTLPLKDLAQLAKRRGIRGWQEMKKDQLVQALHRVNGSPPKGAPVSRSGSKGTSGKSSPTKSSASREPAAKGRVAKAPAAKSSSKSPVSKSPVSKSAAGKSPVSKNSASKAPASKASTNKASTNKASTSKASSRTVPNSKAPVSKAPARKSSSGKAAPPRAPSAKSPPPASKQPPAAKAGASAPAAKSAPASRPATVTAPAAKRKTQPTPPPSPTKSAVLKGNEKGIAKGGNEGKKPAAATKSLPAPAPGNPAVVRRIHETHLQRERLKDLTTSPPGAVSGKDRIVLMVRDAFWLHVTWELSRATIDRAKAALAEHWHLSRPVLRVVEVETGNTTSTAERVLRYIEIHGSVRNWFIDVGDPPKSFRVDIGYLAANGRFQALARSNVVTTQPLTADFVDDEWAEDVQSYEKIFALSGGHAADSHGDLQDLFEERLKRPMGPPSASKFGLGAQRALGRKPDREFKFEVDADMIVYGQAKPNSYVTLGGEPIKLREDGTFTIRLNLPDRRQVLPLVASNGEGTQQRTIVLSVERNTKVMEPMSRESTQ